jgi:hypothetical protein
MAEKSAESAVGKYLGAPIGGALAALITWATAGSTGAIRTALVSLLAVVGGLSGLALTLLYRRYLPILGANRRVAAERQAYDALRDSLAGGNLAARLYSDWLTRFLDWIDRFFGDAGMANQTLFPRAFGLKTPAPLWTAPAFERCLLIALVYPVAVVFVTWAISGHVGPAEVALRLKPDITAWRRALSLICLVLVGVPISWSDAVTLVVKSVLVCISVLISGAPITGALGGVLISVVARLRGDEGTIGAWMVSGFASFFAFEIAYDTAGFGPGILSALGICGAIGISFWFRIKAITFGRYGVYLSLFAPTLALVCLGIARGVSSSYGWHAIGPLLLFFGLLTLLNAPFDWASLGLTRALLRRGLELGGWWPYALALVDAGLAALVIAMLALTMVVGVQAYDALAFHGGGAPVLPLESLFNGIAAHPSAPEYWWLYALLFSTMIPSLINLVIGGTSLVRGVPGVPSLLLRFVPERGAVLKWDRGWIATILTAQVAVGAALGIAAQALLVVGILGYIMPFFGLELLDMARNVAAFNLPGRVGQIFGVGL